ncbi:MAG TPA: DUF2378 family protein [Polyangiaceae bacterium]|nr:DUF2378 family protein [Polyangiaceae bacterium]
MKGVAFHTFFQALGDVRGAAAADLAQAELPPELRDRLRLGGVSRVGYYPMAEYAELHSATQRALRGGESLARSIGKAATDIDTRGLLRFVLGLTLTDLLLRHAGKVWASFARGSQVTVDTLAPRRYVVTFDGLVGANDLVHVELEGAIERLVERTGARVPEVRRDPDADGTSVRYRVSWE